MSKSKAPTAKGPAVVFVKCGACSFCVNAKCWEAGPEYDFTTDVGDHVFTPRGAPTNPEEPCCSKFVARMNG